MRACNCARASPLQSRTRVGCDSMRNTFDIVSSQFQSTHPRGVRLNGKPSAREVKMVSIHAPAWGATQGSASIRSCRNWFQSTHPRGVRRGQHPARTHPGPVSIHAPAWGATPSWSRAGRCPASFNPRTRVGCDAFRQVGTKSLTGFNPRTRVGCDLGSVMPPFFVPRFNPRTRVGCDFLGL